MRRKLAGFVQVADMGIESTPDPVSESDSADLLLFDDGSIRNLHSPQVAILAVAVTWVPLIALAAVQGLALGPSRAQSVLLDPAILVRFLVALPILIIAPSKSAEIINDVANHFLRAELLDGAEVDRFRAIVRERTNLRKSRVAEFVCVALAYVFSAIYVLVFLRDTASSWRTLGPGGHHSLSLAGWWFVTICEPLYLFVLLRFLYRIALWWVFLWKTSRLNLQLHSVHPDGAGGLGFLGLTLNTFRLPAFAISASFAGGVADLVLLNGVPASELKYEIVALILFVVGLFVVPLCLFYQRELSRARDRDVLNYWVLISAQLREFEKKWIASDSDRMATLTSADFAQVTGPSSLLEGVRRMTLLPFETKDLLFLVATVLVPFIPVAALVIPLASMLRRILELVA
jgi:hypothetical protein